MEKLEESLKLRLFIFMSHNSHYNWDGTIVLSNTKYLTKRLKNRILVSILKNKKFVNKDSLS